MSLTVIRLEDAADSGMPALCKMPGCKVTRPSVVHTDMGDRQLFVVIIDKQHRNPQFFKLSVEFHIRVRQCALNCLRNNSVHRLGMDKFPEQRPLFFYSIIRHGNLQNAPFP